MAYKTPGVYVVEQNAFPNSVVEVATAVPAFIGHTEKADNKGVSLTNKAWRITSLSQFIDYYGGAPTPSFSLSATAPKDGSPSDFAITSGGTSTPYWLQQDGGKYLLYYSMQLFFQNGGGACYIVSVGDYTKDIEVAALEKGIDSLKREQEPTMVVIPEAVLLSDASAADLKGRGAPCISVQQAMLQHCGQVMRNRFAILDVYEGFRDRADPAGDCVAEFRDALGTNNLDFAAAYYPWVDASIVQTSDLNYLNLDDASRSGLIADLLKTDMAVDGKVVPAPAATELIPKKNFDDKVAAADAIKTPFAIGAPAELKTAADVANKTLGVHQLLTKFSPLYVTLMGVMARHLNRLPPSAALAGLYTSVDNSRGVWKAPANVSLNSVIAPTVSVSQEEQEDLNVTTAGKSINAIRAFIGAGVLVWGARTLDGNSLDWRYVNVRRTMIMLEESLRLALAAYVFEPNTANTWVTVKGMISNFLNGIWKRGGLAGAAAADAFSVFVGLGETMTAEDILEGRMNITVLVALSRPAEFIEITFQQQMQKS